MRATGISSRQPAPRSRHIGGHGVPAVGLVRQDDRYVRWCAPAQGYVAGDAPPKRSSQSYATPHRRDAVHSLQKCSGEPRGTRGGLAGAAITPCR
jgi:hypothetical protein